MSRLLLMVGMLAGLFIVVARSVQSQSDQKKPATGDAPREEKTTDQKSAANRTADEAAIRANIAAFVRAYNAGDAKAVAALFVPDGLIMDKEENTAKGR